MERELTFRTLYAACAYHVAQPQLAVSVLLHIMLLPAPQRLLSSDR